MPCFMLDTNILSHAIRNPKGAASDRMRVLADEICTSIIVAAELRFGVAKSGRRRLVNRVDELLRTLEVVAFDSPADVAYGDVRAQLERAGKTIGPNDMLIAAHALSLRLTLVTDNEREFSRVHGLTIENWLR
jgi:tRNA(fMet)-specific endonuclease VapC